MEGAEADEEVVGDVVVVGLEGEEAREEAE